MRLKKALKIEEIQEDDSNWLLIDVEDKKEINESYKRVGPYIVLRKLIKLIK